MQFAGVETASHDAVIVFPESDVEIVGAAGAAHGGVTGPTVTVAGPTSPEGFPPGSDSARTR